MPKHMSLIPEDTHTDRIDGVNHRPSSGASFGSSSRGYPGRNVILVGGSGLVGQEILKRLLCDRSVGRIHMLSRRQLAPTDNKVTQHLVDFSNLPKMVSADEIYVAIGTTMEAAGSLRAFRALDYSVALSLVRKAVSAGASRVGIVSAMTANANSFFHYSRVKGELEIALARLDTRALVIARPSLLVGDRRAIGQPARPREVLGLGLTRLLGPFIPSNYRPISAADVASALCARVPLADGQEVLLSGAMRSRECTNGHSR